MIHVIDVQSRATIQDLGVVEFNFVDILRFVVNSSVSECGISIDGQEPEKTEILR